jgi:PQQ-dependent catabolism-associated CXXCW motif protein
MRAGAPVLIACAVAALVAATAHANGIPTTGAEFDASTGYRTSRYRAPLPEWAPGSTRIFAADLPALIEKKNAILLDVMAAEGGGYDPATGAWRLTKIHDTIPGSIWLPDVGRGRIDPRIERYFSDTLARLTNGGTSRAIVIFCQSDCWMSWNAVRRAALLGYQHIYWFPEGIDGWRDWDGPAIPAVPLPVP